MIRADYDQWRSPEESRGDGWVDLAGRSQIMTHRSFYPQASILPSLQYNSLELSFELFICKLGSTWPFRPLDPSTRRPSGTQQFCTFKELKPCKGAKKGLVRRPDVLSLLFRSLRLFHFLQKLRKCSLKPPF